MSEAYPYQRFKSAIVQIGSTEQDITAAIKEILKNEVKHLEDVFRQSRIAFEAAKRCPAQRYILKDVSGSMSYITEHYICPSEGLDQYRLKMACYLSRMEDGVSEDELAYYAVAYLSALLKMILEDQRETIAPCGPIADIAYQNLETVFTSMQSAITEPAGSACLASLANGPMRFLEMWFWAHGREDDIPSH